MTLSAERPEGHAGTVRSPQNGMSPSSAKTGNDRVFRNLTKGCSKITERGLNVCEGRLMREDPLHD